MNEPSLGALAEIDVQPRVGDEASALGADHGAPSRGFIVPRVTLNRSSIRSIFS